VFKKRTILAQINQPETIVGTDVELQGKLESAGNIQINGIFNGEVNAEGDVIVSTTGKVNAPISARNVTVAGTVFGNINTSEELEILESGKVFGDIACKILSVKPGGAISGKVTMHASIPEQEIVKPTYEMGE